MRRSPEDQSIRSCTAVENQSDDIWAIYYNENGQTIELCDAVAQIKALVDSNDNNFYMNNHTKCVIYYRQLQQTLSGEKFKQLNDELNRLKLREPNVPDQQEIQQAACASDEIIAQAGNPSDIEQTKNEEQNFAPKQEKTASTGRKITGTFPILKNGKSF
ncbi:MAG: hypothetical protein HUK20_13550 [Fibrobacter sp.]|nr:hypothetical protein [Fibrobacter sp.]